MNDDVFAGAQADHLGGIARRAEHRQLPLAASRRRQQRRPIAIGASGRQHGRFAGRHGSSRFEGLRLAKLAPRPGHKLDPRRFEAVELAVAPDLLAREHVGHRHSSAQRRPTHERRPGAVQRAGPSSSRPRAPQQLDQDDTPAAPKPGFAEQHRRRARLVVADDESRRVSPAVCHRQTAHESAQPAAAASQRPEPESKPCQRRLQGLELDPVGKPGGVVGVGDYSRHLLLSRGEHQRAGSSERSGSRARARPGPTRRRPRGGPTRSRRRW